MTNQLNEDFFEESYRTIRRTPSMWSEMNESIDEPDFEAIRDLVYERISVERRIQPFLTRMRMKFLGIFVIFTVVGGGALATAHILTTDQPKIVAAGTVCRAEAKANADAMVSGPSDDPISFCKREWESGEFTKQRGNGPVPPLAACISKQHIIEIFPGYEEVCGQMGLSIANLELSSYQKGVIELQKRTAEKVNAECIPLDEGILVIKKILGQLHLEDWKIAVGNSPKPGPCSLTEMDETERSIMIYSIQNWRNNEKFISR